MPLDLDGVIKAVKSNRVIKKGAKRQKGVIAEVLLRTGQLISIPWERRKCMTANDNRE